METTGYTYTYEFLAIPENTPFLHGRKGKETVCKACFEADGISHYCERNVIETHTERSSPYLECSQCGECISER